MMILFGIFVSLGTFLFGKWIQKTTKINILNPILIAIVLTVVILLVLDIPFEEYNKGGCLISLFLPPTTASLALSIYRQKEILKKNLLPVLIGCLVGSIVSIISVFGFCKLFGVSEVLTLSLVPKSVTTPIAMDISGTLGGIPAITVAAVVVTGILGYIICPFLRRIFRVDDASAAGIAIGTCSHAVGTSKALELGPVEGAMSGIAIGIAGIMTVIVTLFL